ncbi:hypothetical protein [Streptomyces sp. NPDC005336]|uniref:hypothetical protein n=1 Tax=Streptomyces sp. NPDC005336 TaxID=3157035 RepID=UPI0033A1D6D4
MGIDSTTGKRAYVVAEPGGALERMADVAALKTATVLTALVGEVLESGKASDAELAMFVSPLLESLNGVTEVAARLLDSEA